MFSCFCGVRGFCYGNGGKVMLQSYVEKGKCNARCNFRKWLNHAGWGGVVMYKVILL